MQAVLSHYRILEEIGAGGMGVVYRAHDERLDRDVALKLLPLGMLTDEVARRRFRREALALSKLNHPNIATIHDFDTQDGTDFLVEEFIEGLSLDQLLLSGPLPEKEIVQLGGQLCEGLAAAHKHRVIHRDLKPGNVRVTPDARLKILDFGLAVVLRGETSPTATTASISEPHIAGTLPYMAPEQLLGRNVDARTDIWAAGCVLYEMSTGRRPFLGKDSALFDEILHQAPAEPSKLNPCVTSGLQAVILKCLEKDPKLRYQSAEEVASDLHHLAEGPLTNALRSRRRSLAAKRVVVSVIATAILGTVVWLLFTPKMKSIQTIAVLPIVNLSGEPQQEYFADGLTDSLINDLARLTGLKGVIARASVMRFKETKQPLEEIARELKVDALITGAVLRSGNQVRVTAQLIDPKTGRQLWTEHYEREIPDMLRLQNDLTAAIAGEIRVKLQAHEQAALKSAGPINGEAYDAYLMGRYQTYKLTPAGFDKALEYFQIALKKDPNFTPASLGIAEVWALREHLSQVPAGEGWEKARPVFTKVLETHDNSVEAHQLQAGYLAWHKWQWDAGVKEYQRAIELNPNEASAHFFYSLTLHAMRRAKEAREEMERAIELDPYNAMYQLFFAFELKNDGRSDELLLQLQKVASLTPSEPLIHLYRWTAYEEKGMYKEAVDEMKEYYIGIKKPEMALVLERGYRRGDYRAGMRALGDALVAAGADKALSLASIYVAAGEDDRALDLLQKAFDRRLGPLPYVNAQERWSHLRSQPRFQQVLQGMNLSD